jgi:hypothetical protein
MNSSQSYFVTYDSSDTYLAASPGLLQIMENGFAWVVDTLLLGMLLRVILLQAALVSAFV